MISVNCWEGVTYATNLKSNNIKHNLLTEGESEIKTIGRLRFNEGQGNWGKGTDTNKD